MTLAAAGPNADQIRYWNEVSGPKWVALEKMLDAQISSLGVSAMDRAGIAAGERVVDVGCGCGQTSLQLGERVGPEGEVCGVDVSGVMLTRARERAAQRRLGHVRFENADAETFSFALESSDVVFSRFGVMFFANPTLAFANLAGALVRGGRLAFVCWQKLDRNPWMLVPLLAAAQHVPLPAPPAPGAPGPFSFADPQRVRDILEGAGFRDVAVESLESELGVGGEGPLERTVGFLLQMGPAAAALREAADETRARAAEAVRDALGPYATVSGVRMQSAAWIVTGRRV